MIQGLHALCKLAKSGSLARIVLTSSPAAYRVQPFETGINTPTLFPAPSSAGMLNIMPHVEGISGPLLSLV